LHVAALGWDTWRNTWLQLTHAAALDGQATVLTGSLTPGQLERLPARKSGRLRFNGQPLACYACRRGRSRVRLAGINTPLLPLTWLDVLVRIIGPGPASFVQAAPIRKSGAPLSLD
jgi:hypothetical protein